MVDLGFGEAPWTSLELGARLTRINPGLSLLGVEIDAERVRLAEPYAGPSVTFRRGGFELALAAAEGRREVARVVRAFNVLRQYDVDSVAPALRAMGAPLEEGGLLLEGSSDPLGRVWAAQVWRRLDGALHHEALAMGLRPGAGAEPLALRAVLPKGLIHELGGDHPVAGFFRDWALAWRDAARPGEGPASLDRLARSARTLREAGHDVDPRRRWLGRGMVVWRMAGVGTIDLLGASGTTRG